MRCPKTMFTYTKFFSINAKAASFNDKVVLEIINLWKKKKKKKGKVRAVINFTTKKK